MRTGGISSIDRTKTAKMGGIYFAGDVRLAHEQMGSSAFVVHSPKNDKSKPQIQFFNDIFVIDMLQVFEDDHTRHLGK